LRRFGSFLLNKSTKHDILAHFGMLKAKNKPDRLRAAGAMRRGFSGRKIDAQAFLTDLYRKHPQRIFGWSFEYGALQAEARMAKAVASEKGTSFLIVGFEAQSHPGVGALVFNRVVPAFGIVHDQNPQFFIQCKLELRPAGRSGALEKAGLTEIDVQEASFPGYGI
jgi:hypothetical protein